MKKGIKTHFLKKVFNLLTNLSDENIIKVLKLGEKIAVKKDLLDQIRNVRILFEKKHPSAELLKRLFKNSSKQCREKLIENFFMNAIILNRQKQEKLSKELGFGLPWFFVISPTARCNLDCVGCYAGSYVKEEGLSFNEIDRILTEAKELGIYFITVSGGEPFIRKDLLDIFKKHNDMYFQVYTNSTLITKEVAQKLAELGNVAPGISIEGFEKETDSRRGKGTFKKIMQAMDNLREAGVPFGFSVTPTKRNYEVISSEKFMDMLVDKGCSFGWYFQYVPIGKKPDTSLMCTPQQRVKLGKWVDKMRNEKPIFIGDFWNDGPYVCGCIAGARPHGGYFHINCKGDVEPCVFLQFSVDNIKGKKLVDVIQSPFFKAIRYAQPYCKNKNLCTPCALIDNPWVLRHVVKTYGAKPSYNGGNGVIEDPKVTKFLDKYSKEMHKITKEEWEKNLSLKHKPWKDKY